MDFVNIFIWSRPSWLHLFVHFENSSIPRIWKVSDLVFIFNILFRFKQNFQNDQKSRENRTNMDIILLFLGKPLDKHGITPVHITYPHLGFFVAA